MFNKRFDGFGAEIKRKSMILRAFPYPKCMQLNIRGWGWKSDTFTMFINYFILQFYRKTKLDPRVLSIFMGFSCVLLPCMLLRYFNRNRMDLLRRTNHSRIDKTRGSIFVLQYFFKLKQFPNIINDSDFKPQPLILRCRRFGLRKTYQNHRFLLNFDSKTIKTLVKHFR